VEAGDSRRLSAIPGIGKKTAERIVLELGGKLAADRRSPMGPVSELASALKNLGFKPTRIIASLILPKEFSTSKPKITLEIDQRTESTLEFPIKNFSALPGANYPVFCYFEYDSENTHHTAVARCLVTIARDENLFRRFRWLWISLAAVLAAILVVMIIKERKKRMR
jgi:cytochrome oxidase assembly protein ShyY1